MSLVHRRDLPKANSTFILPTSFFTFVTLLLMSLFILEAVVLILFFFFYIDATLSSIMQFLGINFGDIKK